MFVDKHNKILKNKKKDMDLVFITDARFVKANNQKIYSLDSASTNVLWNRYLKEFDHLIIMARVRESSDFIVDDNLLAVNERVSFIELPYYVGPIELSKVYLNLRKKIKQNIFVDRAYICRWGQITSIAYKEFLKKKIPYAVEVIGDPYDVFAPGAFQHPLRPLFRYVSYSGLKRNVKYASSALYVTKDKLQKRYPVREGVFNVAASDVMLSKENIASASKVLIKKGSYRIISVGSLEQMYKSPDIVLQAVSILKKQSVNVELIWIGDGEYRESMIKLTQELNIADRVAFIGQVSIEKVRGFLDKTDIFVLASRTEGLPRALVEAMAAGLPCIATRVGGIPELLPQDVLITPNDPKELASKIKDMIENCDFANRQAKDNLEKSHQYSSEILEERRLRFLRKVKTLTKDNLIVVH